MHRSVRYWILLILLVLASGTLPGQEKKKAKKDKTDPSLLTLDRIYKEKEFETKSASVRWLKDGSGYSKLRASKSTPGGKDIVLYHPESEEPEVLVPAERLVPPRTTTPLMVEGYTFSANRSHVLIYTNSKRVWRQNTRGDYWTLDRASHELRQLGGDAKPATLMFATFSPDGKHVAYVRENNIYIETLQTNAIRQLTKTDSSHVINGTFDWVYEEELGLRNGLRWSPDGKRIAYWQIDTTGVREFPLVDNTSKLYPTIQWLPYPKVGQVNSICRVGVVEIADAKTTWLDVPGDPRNHYIARMEWAENSQELLLQQLNRLQNTNRVMLANADEHTIATILTEKDEAWVDIHDELNWIDEGQRFTWLSERDGWRHIYLVSRDGKQQKLITPGEFDVMHLVHVDDKAGWIYYYASPQKATQQHLYRVRFDGTGTERVSPKKGGWHSYQISPNGQWAVYSHMSFDNPPVARLVKMPSHEEVRVLEDNKKLKEKLDKLARTKTEFFRVDIGDGVKLDAWCMKPPKFDAEKKYPLVVYVYGEPAGQTVLDRWSSRHYLWHLLLAQKGYVVISVDNRGTPAPRGRAWRKQVYRQVGILAPQDQAAALKAILAKRSYLDADRVGIWGWSGGGSMTLNAMFKYPELYKTGISIAPVPNMRYYDTIYQERYMGLPDDNVEGYLKGSPINYAKNLKGNLLVVHGTGDDNCHYATTEKLVNELIRHNKPFQMMAYPNRSHSIKEGTNTTLHLRTLMTNYLLERLPPKPKKP